jgi:Xaa-Pro aminopeptidase/Xaa-Pro dipeptidase
MQHENRLFPVRVSLLRQNFSSFKIDNLIILDMNNIRYLTGFTGSEGVLLISKNKVILLVDGRYTAQAKIETINAKVIEYKDKIEGIGQVINDFGLKNIGFEAGLISVQMYNKLSEKFPKEIFRPLGDELKLLRVFKDESEISLMREAADISSSAINSLVSDIRSGCTEKELALQLEIKARRAGADQLAFEAIIASGENSALPHAKPSGRKIRKGDFIVIDFGVKYKGYCSDETCTFAFGKLTAEQKNAYQIVKDAHDRAIDTVRANIPASEIDRCVRRIFGERYEHYFSHGTGHGVGLEVHEAPRLAPNSPDVLEAQMVVTIEPGLYIPGRWGIRIEDMVLVKENSCEKLSKMDKELIIIE